MSGSITDITPRKQAEEKLKRSEERFRNLMEQSPLAIEILTPEGRITEVNAAWKRLWGVNEDEAALRIEKCNMLTDPQLERLGVQQLVERAFAGEPVVLPAIQYSAAEAAEDVIESRRGGLRSPWIQSHLYPVEDADGKILYVVNTYLDVTDVKRAEREVREQRDALARMDRTTSLGQLTGSIAHELNQPLTGILSNAKAAQLMTESGHWKGNEWKEIMADIEEDAKRAGRVIRNLRDLFREQKGEFQPVDINAVVAETERLFHSEFVLQNVNLTTECARSIPLLNGNKVQIQQVLVNLITNGIEAMRDVAEDDRRLHVSTVHDTTTVKVWVEDCGPGIAADKVDRIFEPLATWKPGGTGLGLAVSNSIIEAHEGNMFVENRPAGGARVGFALPLPRGGE
jgi:PAS domain S-box-containing protein